MGRVYKGTDAVLPGNEYVGKIININKEKGTAILENTKYGSKVYLNTGKAKLQKTYMMTIYENVFFNFAVGDIVQMNSSGRIEIHFTKGRNDNALFITENCNCNCLSCPQPPVRKRDFDYFFRINKQIIECLDESAKVMGITGGEPLLAKEYFFQTLELLNLHLPETNIQILTNGILLANDQYFATIEEFINNRYLFAVPLYSDFYADHDSMVNLDGAFYKTIKGLYNLASTDAELEIRILLNATTVKRIKQLTSYIFKNLPFVSHVAFMGIESIGNALTNWQQLAIDYADAMNMLEESVEYLSYWNIPVSIYNIPLCNISTKLWPFSEKSISDWKRIYAEECNRCLVKDNCGGLFSTSQRSNYTIKPILE
jgi:His-Xaa-Ser system radical SAM maturase HxsC